VHRPEDDGVARLAYVHPHLERAGRRRDAAALTDDLARADGRLLDVEALEAAVGPADVAQGTLRRGTGDGQRRAGRDAMSVRTSEMRTQSKRLQAGVVAGARPRPRHHRSVLRPRHHGRDQPRSPSGASSKVAAVQ
jgi:hypothetical protein